ncbi:hypothetical protein D3C74_426990 [compost metagenome]
MPAARSTIEITESVSSPSVCLSIKVGYRIAGITEQKTIEIQNAVFCHVVVGAATASKRSVTDLLKKGSFISNEMNGTIKRKKPIIAMKLQASFNHQI